jgi:hypothetical protein
MPIEEEQEQPDNEPDDLDDATAECWYEISKALADVLRNEKIVTALGAWLDSCTAKNLQARSPIPYYVSLVFGLLIFTGIAVLAYRHILDSQATVVLIGALIAAWYGGQRQQPQK